MNLLRTSNSMNVVIDNGTLEYKVLGGIFEFNFFLSRESDYSSMSPPESVIIQYHDWIGKWIIHPLWGFGHHQCRWGYKNVDEMRAAIEGYSNFNLPLDSIWTDIDGLKGNVDFTIDQINFPPEKMTQLLKESKKKYIALNDYALSTVNNPHYELAKEQNFFIKTPEGHYASGTCWPGEINFPDFNHVNATPFWADRMKQWHDLIPFDSVWVDMNEPANLLATSQRGW